MFKTVEDIINYYGGNKYDKGDQLSRTSEGSSKSRGSLNDMVLSQTATPSK